MWQIFCFLAIDFIQLYKLVDIMLCLNYNRARNKTKQEWSIPMKIYFVRHGEPDYKTDTLTEIGHLQAEAAAEQLKNSGIQKIFSSTCGRAVETAQHTADKLGLGVESFDFIREIHWHSKDGQPIFEGGHPWFIADDMVLKGENIFDPNWAESDRFSSSVIGEYVKKVTDGLDEWLKTLGYEREGDFYRVVGEDTDQTVAMFSHAGASSAALAHLFGWSLPWVMTAVRLEFTSITVVEFSNEKGTLTFPVLKLLNDARHLEGLETQNIFGN